MLLCSGVHAGKPHRRRLGIRQHTRPRATAKARPLVRKSASRRRQACSSQRYGQADPALVTKVRAVLDFEDFTRLGGRNLSLGSHGYAQMWDDKLVTLVHRWVAGAKPRDGRIVDHLNGDRLERPKAQPALRHRC